MRRNLLVGVGLGLLVGIVLILGVSSSGLASKQIDLLPSSAQAPVSGQGSSPSSNEAVSASISQPAAQTTTPQSSTPQSAPPQGASVLEDALGVVLAFVLAGAFYGFYNRRLDAE